MARRDFKKGRGQSFAGIDRQVLDHPDYINLSGNAVKVLTELVRQYRGKNNGDLTLANSIIGNRNLGSKSTLKRCVDELMAANLIVKTREGRFSNPGGVCTLYAITWRPINECGGKLEVNPTTAPPRKFSLENNKTPSLKSRRSSSLNLGREQSRNTKGQYSSSQNLGRLRLVT